MNASAWTKPNSFHYRYGVTEIPLPPESMLPLDGRFGAGPSLIRGAQVSALTHAKELGTSHRKGPVRSRVASIREGLTDLFSLPAGYEIALGNGGATAFWSVAASSLVRERARCAVFGEFGAKAAADWSAAPWLEVEVVDAPAGSLAEVRDDIARADVYAYTHNETSTGVASPLYRGAPGEALTVVDATSIAGAIPVDWSLVDTYYFSPQKALGSEGGLWLAVVSPAAQERARELAEDAAAGGTPSRRAATGQSVRYMPSFLNLAEALKNSVADQTLNTPSISTLVLLDEQIKWLRELGGLAVSYQKGRSGAEMIAEWAENRPFAELFVKDRDLRSPVVTTVDLDPKIPASDLASAFRSVGILDIDGYRKLGRNQLRIASFPSVATSDIQALLACIDWVAERLY